MRKRSQHSAFLQQAPAEQDVVALIKRMQQQLAFLEKKLDILINQSQARPLGEKHFSKPFRSSYGHPHRRSAREHDAVCGEKSTDRGRHFESNQSFGHKRKAYGTPRDSDGAPEHRFEKRQDSEKRGFGRKKKPFSNRRKDRE